MQNCCWNCCSSSCLSAKVSFQTLHSHQGHEFLQCPLKQIQQKQHAGGTAPLPGRFLKCLHRSHVQLCMSRITTRQCWASGRIQGTMSTCGVTLTDRLNNFLLQFGIQLVRCQNSCWITFLLLPEAVKLQGDLCLNQPPNFQKYKAYLISITRYLERRWE